MLRLIGRKGCTNCLLAKKQLERKSVEFEYLDLNTLENKEEIIAKAKEKGVLSLPIAIQNDEVVDLKSLIQ